MRGPGRMLALAAVFLLLWALPALPIWPAPPAVSSPTPAQRPTAYPAVAPEAALFPTPPAPTAAPVSAAPYRAVWVSYLEWQQVDFSSSAAFCADIDAMLDDIAALGANVVLAHVRPFGDALYKSAYYPWSHLCTGTQGQDPGFDPLALLTAAAHARGLQVEAWVNPYRLQAGGVPAALCAESPALLHPDWVKQADGGLYLDPAEPDVRQYIAAGLEELCAGYDIDGIHFDDYFYPTADPAFDAGSYAAYTAGGGTLDLDAWRRQNVDELVRLCWQTVHRYPGRRFGIAPQGDPATNLATQYSDAARWLAEPGYVDYLMPQLYWGLDWADPARRLDALAGTWAALPRADGVALYAGLGAYRIGDADAGAEWLSGRALAAQTEALAAAGITGVGLYRYASLFADPAHSALAEQECAALRAAWAAENQ